MRLDARKERVVTEGVGGQRDALTEKTERLLVQGLVSTQFVALARERTGIVDGAVAPTKVDVAQKLQRSPRVVALLLDDLEALVRVEPLGRREQGLGKDTPRDRSRVQRAEMRLTRTLVDTGLRPRQTASSVGLAHPFDEVTHVRGSHLRAHSRPPPTPTLKALLRKVSRTGLSFDPTDR